MEFGLFNLCSFLLLLKDKKQRSKDSSFQVERKVSLESCWPSSLSCEVIAFIFCFPIFSLFLLFCSMWVQIFLLSI
jgi:hypothetical protein